MNTWGDFAEYDGGGYFMQFVPYDTSLLDYRKLIDQMRKNNYLSLETLFIETTFLLYTPSLDYYISCMIVRYLLKRNFSWWRYHFQGIFMEVG